MKRLIIVLSLISLLLLGLIGCDTSETAILPLEFLHTQINNEGTNTIIKGDVRNPNNVSGDFLIGIRLSYALIDTKPIKLNANETQSFEIKIPIIYEGQKIMLEDMTNKPQYKYSDGYEVVYEVTGTATSVSITLSNSTGGTEQIGVAYTPWAYLYKSFPASYLYVSAQNQGKSGTVIANIYMKGVLVKTSTSSGEYVIASASGMK